MIAGIAKVAAGAWKLAGNGLERFGEWLREPRDWWRFTAVVMAVVCLGFAFAVRDARQEVLVVTERCNATVVTVTERAKAATQTAQDNARAVQTCKAQLANEVGERQRIEELARKAVNDARAGTVAAERSMAEWLQQYSKRPATCQAAMEAMGEACASITDY